MFYFIMSVILYLLLIIIIYHYYQERRITILSFLIMLFLLNIYVLLIYKDINITIGFLITIFVILIEHFYNYLYQGYNKEVKNDKVLINRGNINFKGLVSNNYPYNKLINNLKRKGINNLNDIDYCALYNNDLLVLRSDIKSYPISLIIDGKLLKDNLLCIGKDKEWLTLSLRENNLVINEVLYAFYKDQKIYFLTNV